MHNVCRQCGEYRVDKRIDPAGPVAICPLCQHAHPFRHLPLLVVCGPSGTGKSTICERIAATVQEVVALDADILWRPEFNTPETQYREFFETWLRLAKNIGQSGRPVLLFSAGGIPDNVEPCLERRYFTGVRYLALTCDDSVLADRLQARPLWRRSGDEAFIRGQIDFNRWFRAGAEEAGSGITLLDTTATPIDRTVAQVTAWIRDRV